MAWGGAGSDRVLQDTWSLKSPPASGEMSQIPHYSSPTRGRFVTVPQVWSTWSALETLTLGPGLAGGGMRGDRLGVWLGSLTGPSFPGKLGHRVAVEGVDLGSGCSSLCRVVPPGEGLPLTLNLNLLRKVRPLPASHLPWSTGEPPKPWIRPHCWLPGVPLREIPRAPGTVGRRHLESWHRQLCGLG